MSSRLRAQATLAAGWDVVSPEEGALTDDLCERLASAAAAAASSAPSAAASASSSSGRSGSGGTAGGQALLLRRGELLHAMDRPVRHFYVLLEVRDVFGDSGIHGAR